METRRFLLAVAVTLAACLLHGPLALRHAEAQAPPTLTGQVTSAEEGPMEGVVIGARKDGSTISISVVTNPQGRFAFPAERLE